MFQLSRKPCLGLTLCGICANGTKPVHCCVPSPAPGEDYWKQAVQDVLNVIEPASLREVLPQATTDAEKRDQWLDMADQWQRLSRDTKRRGPDHQ